MGEIMPRIMYLQVLGMSGRTTAGGAMFDPSGIWERPSNRFEAEQSEFIPERILTRDA